MFCLGFVEMGYRADIDGLRAIAVLSVLLFHLGVSWVPGGFVGVDIFFVISGYLITRILMRDLKAGQFSLVGFYRKRALRILPALCVVLAVTTLVGSRVMLPSEMREMGQSIIAALLFISNLHFWSQVDYFTPDAKENPLLHTWSLGIEEQFYIILPLILWLMWRYARPWLLQLVGLSVAISLGLSFYASDQMPRASFYLLPTRYWELGAGALLALFAPRLPKGVAEISGLAGFALLAVAIFGLSEDTVFPGAAALLPVVGAVFVIAGHGGSVSRVLSWPVPVWLGRISYSLYLWHWPVIVLWKLRTDPVLDLSEMIALGAVSIALAVVSARYVERPFRSMPSSVTNGAVLGPAALAIIAGIGVGWGLSVSPTMLRGYVPQVAELDRYDSYFDAPSFKASWRYDTCHLDPHSGGFEAYDKAACLKKDERPALLLFGDSHAAHLWQALAAARPDLNVMQASSTNCRPLPDPNATDFCTDLSRFIYHDWVPNHRPKIVALSGVWRPSELNSLVKGIHHLRASGVEQVVVLGDTVTYTATLPKILARAAMSGAPIQAQQAVHLQPDLWSRDRALHELVEQAGATYVSLLDVACPMGECLAEVDGVPFLFDSNHYTSEGAAYVAQRIAGQF